MATVTINASEFKARCLALLDEVAATGETLIVLKRGKPVVRVIPAGGGEEVPQATLVGTVEEVGDIVGPVLPESDWDALSGDR
jgi:prevent-host-death family protein